MNGPTTLIPRPSDALLPQQLEQRLRRLLVDKFTGNVRLNVKDGRIRGFVIEELVDLPS